MATANEALFDALVRHQIGLLRLSGGIRNRVHQLLDATEDDMAAQITRRLANHKGLDTPASVRRLERLLVRIRETRTTAWSAVQETWRKELRALARAEPVTMAEMIRAVSPVRVTTALPPASDLSAIVTRRPFQGRVLRDWARDVARADLSRIQAQIRIGMVQGENSRAIARRIVGTVRNRGRDGVTQITRRNAEAITRTAVNHISNRARSAFFAENAALFSEERYVATLDSQTTILCASLDGRRFPVGLGRVPPLHWGCRSLRVPILSGEAGATRPANPTTERMLLRKYAEQHDIARVTKRADLPRGHKGKFDAFARTRKRELIGQVPAKTTYQEWLTRQTAEFQNDVLGKAKGKLFREGRLTLDKFVDQKGKTLTLQELGRREAAAFQAAGLDPVTGRQPRLSGPRAVPYSGSVRGVDVAGAHFPEMAPVSRDIRVSEHAQTPDFRPRSALAPETQEYLKTDGPFYQDVNAGLRSGNPSQAVRAATARINRDMRPLTRNYHLYRGDSRTPDYPVGHVFGEPGFSSTSIDPSVAHRYSQGKTLYQFVGPKGTRAIVENEVEAEVMLPRKRKFRVVERYRNVDVGDRKVDNYYVVELLED